MEWCDVHLAPHVILQSIMQPPVLRVRAHGVPSGRAGPVRAQVHEQADRFQEKPKVVHKTAD